MAGRVMRPSRRARVGLLSLMAVLPPAILLIFQAFSGGNSSLYPLAVFLSGAAVLVAGWLGGNALFLHATSVREASRANSDNGPTTQQRELGRLTAALSKSEQEYRYLFHRNPMPMWVYDLETLKFLAVNEAAVLTYGYSHEEFMAMTIKSVRRPEDVPALLDLIPRLPPGISARTSWQHRRKDGTQIEVDLISNAIRFRGHNARIVLINDVTERRRMEAALFESERQHRQLFENNPLPIVVCEEGSLRILAVNEAVQHMYGYTKEEFLLLTFLDVIPNEDRLAALERISLPLTAPTRVSGSRHKCKDGSVIYVETVSHPLKFQGKSARIVMSHNITARRQAEEALRESDHYHRLLFEKSPVGLALCRTDMSFADANPAFAQIIGRSVEDVLKLNYRDIVPNDDDPEEARQFKLLREAEHFGPFERRLLHAHGHTVPVRMTGRVIERGGEKLVWSSVEDLTKSKAAERRILHLAHHDAVTGLPNRNLLLDRVAHDIAHVHRKNRGLALLFIDLDRFKNINDTLGHEMGDALLQEVARKLAGCLRASDTVARLGGDEFVIVLPDLMANSDAAVIGQKIIESMQKPLQVHGYELHITPSIGIAIYPEDGLDAMTLMKNADVAMYRAKEVGRNNYQFFTSEMNSAAVERLAVETFLRRAIVQNEFLLYYQPVWDMHRNRIDGFEALIRWQHPQWGLVGPPRFIAVAEDSGLILSIGQWVLREACRQIKTWHAAGHTDICVSVNLSTRQFKQTDLVESIAAILMETGVDGRFLGIEVTESLMIQDREMVIATLNRIKDLGIRTSIDDFGTGYSSLSYLQQLPVDQVKIDKSFVHNVLTDPNDAAIAKAIVAMGQSLHLEVVAEGVETIEQVEFLRSLSCDKVQGNYFFEPVPAPLIDQFLVQMQEATAGPQASLGESQHLFRHMAAYRSGPRLN
jgi:diguanylate cyclase (GGDEF)-like protein/PAS domain S-box-containing protein